MSDKELALLVNKVKTIYATTGGKQMSRQDGKKMSEVYKCKLTLGSQLDNIQNLKDALSQKKDRDSVDAIRLKNSLRQELMKLPQNMKNLVESYELEKPKINDEDAEKITILIDDAKALLPSELSREKPVVPTVDDMISGHYKSVPRESMTDQHVIMLKDIENETAEQDVILEQIDSAVENLKHIALNIKDTIESQNVVLDDANERIENTNATLENTNDRMSKATKYINSKSGKICSYIICIIILVVLASILSNLIK
jgi:hypothetical protein